MLSIIPLPWRLLAMALAAVALFSIGWFRGNEHGGQKLIDYIGKQAAETVRVVKLQGAATERIVTKYVKVAGKTKTVTETVEKEVVRYAESNPGACLDGRWRVLHDAAAANVIPPAPGPVDAAGGAPKAAEAIGAVTDNYAACHRDADRLDALQEWVRAQQAVP